VSVLRIWRSVVEDPYLAELAPAARAMRQRSFNRIYVLDLHGSVNEHAPNGTKDENVFDIKQGVAVSLFVKQPGLERGSLMETRDVWGMRTDALLFKARQQFVYPRG